MLCNKCGKEIPENSVFCPVCGNKILTDAENNYAVEIDNNHVNEVPIIDLKNNDQKTKNKKRLILSVITFVLVIVIGIFITLNVNKWNEGSNNYVNSKTYNNAIPLEKDDSVQSLSENGRNETEKINTDGVDKDDDIDSTQTETPSVSVFANGGLNDLTTKRRIFSGFTDQPIVHITSDTRVIVDIIFKYSSDNQEGNDDEHGKLLDGGKPISRSIKKNFDDYYRVREQYVYISVRDHESGRELAYDIIAIFRDEGATVEDEAIFSSLYDSFNSNEVGKTSDQSIDQGNGSGAYSNDSEQQSVDPSFIQGYYFSDDGAEAFGIVFGGTEQTSDAYFIGNDASNNSSVSWPLKRVNDYKYVFTDAPNMTLEFCYNEDHSNPINIYKGTESNEVTGTMEGFFTVTIVIDGSNSGTYKQTSVIANE